MRSFSVTMKEKKKMMNKISEQMLVSNYSLLLKMNVLIGNWHCLSYWVCLMVPLFSYLSILTDMVQF